MRAVTADLQVSLCSSIQVTLPTHLTKHFSSDTLQVKWWSNYRTISSLELSIRGRSILNIAFISRSSNHQVRPAPCLLRSHTHSRKSPTVHHGFYFQHPQCNKPTDRSPPTKPSHHVQHSAERLHLRHRYSRRQWTSREWS
jgi:hypothetical protein